MKAFLSILAAAFALASISTAHARAQTTPPSPQATTAPSPAATPQATKAPATSAPKAKSARGKGRVKKLRAGSLTVAQVKYALTHPAQEVASLRKIRKLKFENLRLQRVPATILKALHADASQVAYSPMSLQDVLAQTAAPKPGGLLGSFLNIIANVNVSDALNNALNQNTVNLSLSNVLNGNNVAIGQLVGVYVNSAGIVTTLIK